MMDQTTFYQEKAFEAGVIISETILETLKELKPAEIISAFKILDLALTEFSGRKNELDFYVCVNKKQPAEPGV